MKNKILLTLVLGVFLISFASAQIQSLGVFKIGDDINLIQTCDNCTFNNITSVLYPNSSVAISNVQMTKDGTFYNYTFSGRNTIGIYIVNGFGDLDGIDTVWNYDFEITSFGTKISNSGIIYAVLLLIIFAMDLLVFLLIFSLRQEKNFTDLEDNFVGVSIKKYLRVVLIGASYGLILITLNLMNAAATTISEITQFSGILGGIYLAMGNAAWVWTISIIIWMGIMIVKDGNLIKETEKRMEEANHF